MVKLLLFCFRVTTWKLKDIKLLLKLLTEKLKKKQNVDLKSLPSAILLFCRRLIKYH